MMIQTMMRPGVRVCGLGKFLFVAAIVVAIGGVNLAGSERRTKFGAGSATFAPSRLVNLPTCFRNVLQLLDFFQSSQLVFKSTRLS